MTERLFPLAQEHEHLAAKVFAGLERLSHVFTALHGRAGAQRGLTSLQVFLLLETSSRKLGVRELAARFSVSRPTVSRSLAVLAKKKLVEATTDPDDGRRVVFTLTPAGEEVVTSVGKVLQAVLKSLEMLPTRQQEALWEGLLSLLLQWEREGLMASARMCPTCRFFRGAVGKTQAFCELLGRSLTLEQLRLDCPDHEKRT